MPVIDHPPSAITKRTSADKYGCWNGERLQKPLLVKDGHLEIKVFQTVQLWKTVPPWSSEECRYDHSLTDPRCEGCMWAGTGEAYAKRIRELGK